MKLTFEKQLKIYNLQQTLKILWLLPFENSYAYLFSFSLNLVDNLLVILKNSHRFDK